MKSSAATTNKIQSRKDASPRGASAGEFNEVLMRLDLDESELYARFRRAAPMLSWPGAAGLEAA